MNKDIINFNNDIYNWDRFCDVLWFAEDIRFWIDTSKIDFNSEDINNLSIKLNEAFIAINKIELGNVSNIDENRQVGHYWLRTPALCPSISDRNLIQNEIKSVSEFASMILEKKIVTKSGHNFTNVLWIGIGGSALGPQLIVNALKTKEIGLDFSFIDNIDPYLISEVLEELKQSLPTTLFVVVSKSGGTPEPKICMNQVEKYVSDLGIDWASQAVAITMLNSDLYSLAINDNWLKIFNMPDWVGGRTSITSSVGLLPLALLAKDISQFLQGASLMDQHTRSDQYYKNPAALLASCWYFTGDGKGQKDMVVLPYRDRLSVFSKYLQQLVMESLGKSHDRNGKRVSQGISVFGNKGSTDQHAYIQQLRDGVDNFFAVFIEVLEDSTNLSRINNESPSDFLSGFFQGTRSALSQNGRQSITITFDKLNSFTLGSLIALFERAVSLYAELIDINAYNQPGVEAGKTAAKKIIDLQFKVEYLMQDYKSRSILDIQESINGSNKEELFFILRHMTYSNKVLLSKGEWSSPNTLIFTRISD
tara:strand:+ start:13165 stop:14769 length:1605 start_codon:yes stop_codon:yes gene_type:complete